MSNVQAERGVVTGFGWPKADPSFRYSWPLPNNKELRVINIQQTLLGPGSLTDEIVLKWKNSTGRDAQWVYLPTAMLQGIHQKDDERYILYIRVEKDDPLSTVVVSMTVAEPHTRLGKNFRAVAEWTREDVSRCIGEYSQALLQLGQKACAGVAVQRHQVS